MQALTAFLPGCYRGAVLDSERTSLVAETLEEMASDEDSRKLAQQLQARGQAALTREERRARQRSLESLGAPSFPSLLEVQSPFCMIAGCACARCQARGGPIHSSSGQRSLQAL